MSKWPYSTQKWQRYRRQKLQLHPLCEYCLNDGRIEPAIAVDHIVPIARGGNPYPPLEHLMSCCASHHNQKTRAEQLDKPFTPKGVRGCDVHGNPLDPNHHWYKS